MTRTTHSLCVVGGIICFAFAGWLSVNGTASQDRSDPAPRPEIAWSVPGAGWGRPVADSTTAYFLTAAHDVVAFDAMTSRQRWRHSIGGSGNRPLGSQLVLAGSVVVAADSLLMAFDRGQGHTRWRFEPDDGGVVGPYLGAVGADTVFCGSSSGRVYAIDAASGHVRWSAQAVSSAVPTTVYQPIVGDGLVLASFTQFGERKKGGIIALDRQDGSVRWRTPLPGDEAWAGGLAISHGIVIATSAAADIVALSAATGTVIWTVDHQNSSVPLPSPDYRPIVIADNLVIAGSLVGHVIAYEVESGRERWRASGLHRGSVAMAMVGDGHTLYVPYVSGRLLALESATGRELWFTETSIGRFLWAPTWNNDYVFASSESAFVAFRR